MSNEKHNFELVFPHNVSKFAFPPTEKQKTVVSQFSTPYPDNLKCFVNQYNEEGKKVLLVVDDFITQSTNFKGDAEESDLDRNCIYSGKEGAGLQNIIAHAVGKISHKVQLKQIVVFNWCFTDFHFPLNSKKNDHISAINTAYEAFYDRLIDFIKRYKPNAVYISSVTAWEYFNSRMQNDTVTNQRMLMGRVMRGRVDLPRTKWKLKLNKNKSLLNINRHYFSLMGCIDCKKLVAWDVSATKHPNLIGYWSDCFTQLINGRNRYKISLPRDVKFVNVNTIEKFNRLLREVSKQKIVSIDTETEDLGRIKNTLYTIQFCYDGRVGYTLPVDHPDTPFTTQQRKYIKAKLKEYFEHGKSLYHIYQNGKFDIPVLFACCGVRFYNHRVYDIQSGEFAINENIKLLSLWNVKNDKKRKLSPYALDFIAERYGCSVYRNIEFSKGNRGSIGTEGLTKRFIEYCGYDVIVPFHIHLYQIAEAKRLKHRKFLKFVCEQLSDTIFVCGQIEHTGHLIDKVALFELKSSDGAIARETREVLDKFKKSKACCKVNEYLMKKEGIPQGKGFFGKQVWLFDIKKTEHKQLLFFKALGLKPLAFMKDVGQRVGYGKVDKKFKKTYKDVKEIQLFQQVEDLTHFSNNFITPIYDKLTTNRDSLFDGRLRAFYDFIRVSSGRLSSFDPNLQNIPARGNLAKKVKRIFIAKPGCVLVDMDYAAHEVKDLANEAKDEILINSFYAGLEYRSNLRILAYKYSENLEEWLELAKRVQWNDKDKVTDKPILSFEQKVEIVRGINNPITREIGQIVLDIEAKGDIHKLNAVRFFDVENALLVTSDQRYEIKAVVFGVIYGKGAPGLAKPKAEGGLGKDEEYCQAIIDKFYVEFKGGADYLHSVHAYGRANLCVESPLGMIRHLSAYLHSRPAMQNAMDRRGPNCVDMQTQCLTEDGWKHQKELKVGDKIYTKNVKTGELELQPIKALTVSNYKGKMWKLNGSIDALVTPNHRWLVDYGKGKYQRPEMKDSTYIAKSKSNNAIHLTADKPIKQKGDGSWSDDEAKLLGWVLTDGYYSKQRCKSISVCQSERRNSEKVNIIDNLFKKLDIDFCRIGPDKLGKVVWKFAKKTGEKIRTLLPNKILTSQVLNSMSTKQLEYLYETMMLGNGSWNNKRSIYDNFGAGTKEKAEAFSKLCVLLGISCNLDCIAPYVATKKYASMPNIPKQTKDFWTVEIKQRHRAQAMFCCSWVKYEGKVWCPTVDNGTFIAKRNNSIYITGNSIIQGVASCMGITAARNLQKLIWHLFVKQEANFPWKTLVNDVHDSLKSEVPIHLVPIYNYLLEHASTTLVHKRYKEVFGYELSIGLEMEFGIGASQDRVKTWDFTHKTMYDKLQEEMEWQNKELGYNNDIAKQMKKVKHNWEIIRKLRLKELQESVKSREPAMHMLLNEKNSMKMGFII